MSSRARAFVVPPDAAVAASAGEGRLVNVLATASRTDGVLGFWEHTERPGEGAALHTHPPAEAFYILEGMFEFLVDDEWIDAPAGSFVFVPPGVVHGFRAGPAGGRKLGMFVPGGNEGLFVEWHALLAEGDVSSERLAELRRRFNVEAKGQLPPRQ